MLQVHWRAFHLEDLHHKHDHQRSDLKEPFHRQDYQWPSHFEELYHRQDERRSSDSYYGVLGLDVVSVVYTCWYHSTISHHMHIMHSWPVNIWCRLQ